MRHLLLGTALLGLFSAPLRGADLQVELDAREVGRRILHAEMKVPVTGGAVTLVYPKWIPGEHGPNGPVNGIANLQVRAGGKTLRWRRDPLDMFAFHVEAPVGTRTLEVALDFLLIPDGTFSSGMSSTSRLAVLNWNQVLLYPEGTPSDALTCDARLRIPKGWSYATALPIRGQSEDTVEFEPVSLSTLVDSPVLAGLHMRTFELGGTPPVFLHVAAEAPSPLEARESTIQALRRLVVEAGLLFGPPHYQSYHFLLTLSDRVAHFGLEHLESSDDRDVERALTNDALLEAEASLLPHEYVHSWNGKYRRPAGLATRDFQEPMQSDLLWIYEGLTEYLGDVLAARAGLWSPEQFRENIARDVAELDHRPGRNWRTLADTALEAQVSFQRGQDWGSLRRDTDFYDEGELIWLAADVRIRKLTKGEKSLDDFCRRFFSGERPGPVPYTLADVVDALDGVAHQDWAAFFAQGVESLTPHPPVGAIEEGGWRVKYAGDLPEFLRAREEADRLLDLTSSLGARIRDEGTLVDVVPGMPLDRAGLSPGMRITAVGSERFTPAVLRRALQGKGAPLTLTVVNDLDVLTRTIDYHDGEQYPVLERDSSRPDLLSPITQPRGRR
jgi:predicted metalloprotease with PDZ domain